MSFLVATASPPFTATGAIQVYAYEPFTYRFLFPPGNTFATFSNTSTNLLGYLSTDATGVNFVGSNGFNSIVSTTGYPLVIVDNQSNVYSNLVFGGAGRFTDASGNPLPSKIVVYANEAFAPISFIPSVPVDSNTAFTQPSLPAAMKFYGSNSNLFILGGQPAATTGGANYVLVASNTLGQVVSANINIQILSERVQLLGGPLSLSLTVGVPITPARFTAIPPIVSSNLSFAYPYSNLPSGLLFTDSSGNPVTGYPFVPSDNIIDLSGTPTVATPSTGTQSVTVPLRVDVTSVFSGKLSASTNLTFNYTETVVFTTPANNAVFPNTFVNLPITPIPFNAVSYFGGGSLITSISSPDLRSDLSLNSTSGVATLTGTPTFVGSNTYTATAVSSTGVSGSIKFTVISQNDVITLTPFADASLNFIIGRPLANPLPGYYSSNLTLTANSLSGQPIAFSTTGFTQGGITVTSNSNSITFSGVPTTLISATVASVTANDGILATTQSVPFAVLNDVFTWSVATPVFLQNQVITPIQISATTLSGRVIISYVATALPTGLVMSRTGLITGTCYQRTGDHFFVTGSTGISAQTTRYNYTIILDALLLSAPAATYSLPPGQVVPPIPLSALLSSGATPATFALKGQTYGLTITPSGVLGGTLYDGIYPNTLAASADIEVDVSTGNSIVASTVTLLSTALNYLGQFQAGNNQFRAVYSPLGGIPGYATVLYSPLFAGNTQVSTDPTNFIPSLGVTSSDIQLNSAGKYIVSLSGLDSHGSTVFGSIFYGDVNYPISSKTFLTATQGSTTLYRSAYSVVYSGTGSTWYALGVGQNITSPTTVTRVYLLKSDDDGQTWTLGYSRTTGSGNWALEVQPSYVSTNPFVVYGDPFFIATSNVDGNPYGTVVLRYSPLADVYMAGGGQVNVSTGGYNYKIYSALRISRMNNPVSGSGEQATIAPAWTTVTSFTNTSGFVSTGGFFTETRDFAIDVPAGTPWVSAGSSYPSLTTTLRWSTDNGFNWNASTNDFARSGLAVTYGAGIWIALGTDSTFPVYAKTSTDGQTWTNLALPLGLFATSTILYSNSSWTIRVSAHESLINPSPDLSADWIVVPDTPLYPSVTRLSPGFNALYPYASNSTLVVTSIDPTIQLISPVNTAYTIMQYTFMTPITLTVNRSTVYFFLTNDGLPNGIRFDTITGTFSGMPLTAGNFAVRIAIKSSSAAYNYFDFTFRIYSPYPQKRQDTASAYTSYVRQEAIIGGAQFSRDSNAFPSENTTVGAAMGPFPPEVDQAPKPCCLPLPSVKN